MKKKLLLDATVWIAFFNEMKAPFILREIRKHGYELYTTQYILPELVNPSIHTVRKIVGHVWVVNVNKNCIRKYSGILHGLTEADISIICMMLADKDLIAVTDDGLLRKHLIRFINEKRIHGTLWIIKDIALKNGIISKNQASNIIKKLKDAGFRIPKNFKL